MNPIHKILTWLLVVWLSPIGFSGQPEARGQDPEKPEIVAARLGFDNAYKLGCWTPLKIDVLGGSEQQTGLLVVTAPDSDGVPTSILSSPMKPVGLTPQSVTTTRMFVRIGKSESPLRVQFIVDGRLQAERKFFVDLNAEDPAGQTLPNALASTNRLILQFGPSLGLGKLVKESDETNEFATTIVKRLEQASDLPTQWFGYEGVDTVLLSTSEPELYRPLLQSTARLAALYGWVEQGGRLAIFCSQSAEELLAANGVLAKFAPGEFETIVPLRQSLPLESFSGSDVPIAKSRRLSLEVPKLVDVQGEILVSGGRQATDLPLVIRGRIGLGEVVFIGLDFDRPPLNDWQGRTPFLQRALGWPALDSSKQDQESNIYQQPVDMSATLRTALDSNFAEISSVPFFLVGALVIGYILLIGPGDYLFVTRVLKRAQLTWITFPAIVIAVSSAAYLLAGWLKGDQFRVNQVEVIDVVAETGQIRGTVWTHFYTPRVDKFDLSIEPKFLDTEAPADARTLVTWLGLPGYMPGGMKQSSGQLSAFDRGYSYSPDLSAMQGVPIQLWSTKTITATWQAKTKLPLESQLKPYGEELVTGQIENSTELALDDALLLYGEWAYYLGKIAPEEVTIIDDDTHPKTVKTSLTNAIAGDRTELRTAEDGTVRFAQAQADVSRLVKAAMFFRAINGRRYTSQFNRYQHSIDLSHLLKQRDVAILLARIDQPGSQWLDGEQPLRSDKDRHWTYYRFVLPVEVDRED